MPFHAEDGSPFFQLARTVLLQANFALDLHIEEPDRIISHYDRVTNLLQTFTQLSATFYRDDTCIQWIETIQQIQRQIIQHLEALQEYAYDLSDEDAAIANAIIPTFASISTGGRPQVSLPWDTITAYRTSNHSWTDIAAMLNISSRTLRRYRMRSNYQDPSPYSLITDEELDQLVAQLIEQTSGVIGSQFMCSLLQDLSHKVLRRRVRESMSRVDMVGNLDRWANLIPRTAYAVREPNALWHMDGNLKLKLYGFVLHASIDGYSRRIIIYKSIQTTRAQRFWMYFFMELPQTMLYLIEFEQTKVKRTGRFVLGC